MNSVKLLDMLERMDPGIILFDEDLSVSYINRAVLLIFSGISKDELFTENIMNLHSERIQRRIHDMLRLMKDSSGPVPFSFKKITAHHQDRYLFMKLIPLLGKASDDTRNCLLVYDITPFITDQKQTFIKIPVTVGREIHLIDPADILYLEAENIYAKICTSDGVSFCDFPLRFLEERLPKESFYRIHRSYLVNLAKVEKVIRERQSYVLLLQGSDVRLPVSRSKATDFSKKIGLK